MHDFFDVVTKAVALFRQEYEAALHLCQLYPTSTALHDFVVKDAELLREFDELRSALLHDTIADDDVKPKYNSLVARIDILHQEMGQLIRMLTLDRLNNDFRQHDA